MENALNSDLSQNKLEKEKDIEALIAGSEHEQAIFLSDLLFKRKYLKNKIKLSPKYWNDDRYKKEFQFYIIKTIPLIKRYTFQALYNVLQSKKGLNVWSPNCPWMIPEFEKEKVRLYTLKEVAKSQEKTTINVDNNTPIFNKNTNNKQSRLDKLD